MVEISKEIELLKKEAEPLMPEPVKEEIITENVEAQRAEMKSELATLQTIYDKEVKENAKEKYKLEKEVEFARKRIKELEYVL